MRLEELRNIVGEEWVTTDAERMADYLADETAVEVSPRPARELALVRPADGPEVAGVLRLANDARVPVFPRGGGTGLCGGAVPTADGIILSLERMKDISVDHANLMVTVGAGVTLGELVESVEQARLFFPPRPGDESAQVGGLVACNAGGARAVKHGVVRNYVKGIEAVLPTGEPVVMGGKLLKNNTGYDLMHLMIGSEGTLAVITRVVLRLFAAPAASATLIVPYASRDDAVASVPPIMQSGVLPLAVEYVDRSIVEESARQLSMQWPCEQGKAQLMIIVEGRSQEDVYSQCETVSAICERHNALEILVGETKKDQERVLRIRGNIYLAHKRQVADSLDVVVPPASVGVLMDAIDGIAERFDTRIPMLGHVGDGNLHPLLMKDLVEVDQDRLRLVKTEIYGEVVGLGGVITAEHGLGKLRVGEMGMSLGRKETELMRGIKRLFDPNNILNPGCAVPLG